MKQRGIIKKTTKQIFPVQIPLILEPPTQGLQIPIENIKDYDYIHLDPQLIGFDLLYLEELPFQLVFESQVSERNERLVVRISQRLENRHKLQAVKIEISSDIDVFFHHHIVLTEDVFKQMRVEQQLNLLYFQTPNQFISIFKDSLHIEKKIKIVLFIMKNGHTQLNLVYQEEFSQTVLVTFDLQPLNEAQTKKQIMYKYNVYKARERKIKKQTQVHLASMKESNRPLYEMTMRSSGLM